jgi:hypothetical protein
VRFDYEVNYLASFRVVCTGALKIIAMDPAQVKEFVKDNEAALNLCGGKQEVNPATLTKFLQNMTPEMAKAMNKKVYVNTVSAGEAVFIPPGWLAGTTVVNGQLSSGLKINLLPKKFDTKPLCFIKSTTTEKAKLQCLDIILAEGGGD